MILGSIVFGAVLLGLVWLSFSPRRGPSGRNDGGGGAFTGDGESGAAHSPGDGHGQGAECDPSSGGDCGGDSGGDGGGGD